MKRIFHLQHGRRGCFAAVGLVLLGCAPSSPPVEQAVPGEPPPPPAAPSPAFHPGGFLHESPPPPDPWREHRLAECGEDSELPAKVERYLGICSEYFRDGSGSDGMIKLEMGLEAGVRHSLILLTLGQLYLLAGQGDPALLPAEGPAADVGDWHRNQQRLLGRARGLLEEARSARPDDAAVDYLLADVARAAGDFPLAEELVTKGMNKCTGGRSFRVLQMYQQLNQHPPRFLGGPAPDYPAAAVTAGSSGEVVLDLLISPAAQVRQSVTVASPDTLLAEAALTALLQGGFEAARVGKYPIWSWLRVTTAFRLEGES